MKIKVFFLSTILFCGSVTAQYTDYNIIKEAKIKQKGVVITAHPLASEAGAKMLKDGGNAFDAIIATQLALAVVYPQAGNIGGGGFLVATTSDGKKIALDFRETAPAKATHDMYWDKKGNANTELSQNGRLAVGIPGSISGVFATMPYAKLPFDKLIQPAIDLAEKGFSITNQEADLLNENKVDFVKYNKSTTVFVKNTSWKAGDLLVQKDLARTLKRIQKNGEKEFYEGETARMIVKEMGLGNGIITMSDLKNYKTKTRQPLTFNYKGHEVVSMPLPSSGGILLAQMLTMYSFAEVKNPQQNAIETVQPMVEAERRAYADRAEYMGDPDFITDKTDMLISLDYLKNRWKSYNPQHATPSKDVGKIIPQGKESTETTHISILDKEGNAVSVTTTLNGLYGSKTVVSGAGFFINNEMDDFSIKPGVPNMYGAVGGEANAIKANKRMLSSMVPTILLKDNKVKMVVGTPGGTTIPTSIFQAIVGVVDFGLNANFSVNAPKFHQQWLPETVAVEKNFPESTVKALENMGYKIERRRQIGRTEMILVDDQQMIQAVADGRGDDSVAIE